MSRPHLHKVIEPDYSITDQWVIDRLGLKTWNTLKDWQKENIVFLAQLGGRGISSLDQGFGKSATCLLTAYLYYTFWPLLIITTVSNLTGFYMQVLEWLPVVHKDDIHIADDTKKFPPYTNLKECIYKTKTKKRKRNCDVKKDGDDICEGCRCNILIKKTPRTKRFKPLNKKINIITHQSARDREEEIREYNFNYIIVDESDKIQNLESQLAQAIIPMCIRAKYCILATGTPLSQSIHLYSQISAVQPKLFDSYESFIERYCAPTLKKNKDGSQYIDKRGSSNTYELTNKLQKYVLYRWTKLQEDEKCTREGKPMILPPKKRQCYKLYLPPEQEQTCQKQLKEWNDACSPNNNNNKKQKVTASSTADEDRMIENMNKMIKEHLHGKKENTTNIMYTKMKTHLALVKRKLIKEWIGEEIKRLDEEKQVLKNTYYENLIHSLPFEVCNNMLSYDMRYKRKIIFWAHSKLTMQTIADYLREHHRTFIYIDGSTPIKQRAEQIIAFQNHKYEFAILSLKACYAGITLTAANITIFTEILENPNIMLQAEDR